MGTRPPLCALPAESLDAMLLAVPGTVRLGTRPLASVDAARLGAVAVDPDRAAALRAADEDRFAEAIRGMPWSDAATEAALRREIVEGLEAVTGTVALIPRPDPEAGILQGRGALLLGWPLRLEPGGGRPSIVAAVDRWAAKQRKHLLLSGFALGTDGFWRRTLFTVRRHAGAWDIPVDHDGFVAFAGVPVSLDAARALLARRQAPDRRGDRRDDIPGWPDAAPGA